VPAPINSRSPNARASAAMLTIGVGEFSGTSITAKPLSSSSAAIGMTSSGRTPRRIATRSQRDS
jgi:hypothetical protein